MRKKQKVVAHKPRIYLTAEDREEILGVAADLRKFLASVKPMIAVFEALQDKIDTIGNAAAQLENFNEDQGLEGIAYALDTIVNVSHAVFDNGEVRCEHCGEMTLVDLEQPDNMEPLV